ncbi:MAG: flagellar hook-associated protein FlgK [Bdellovibrionales bacterium]|nr:flagellar hook-associated protein FlgK [Bdellovibrionales bacterium]
MSFTSKILNNAVSAINAQQAIIANSGNNIANVNTPGYTRRVVNLETRFGSQTGGLAIGNGVQIGSITRITDLFLEGLSRSSAGERSYYEVQNSFLQRTESLFSLTGEGDTIGSAFTEFVSSLDNLTLNPSSIELRSDVLERAQDLVNSISTTYNNLAELQSEAQDRLDAEVGVVNTLTSQIAQLNGVIAGREASGGLAADERDQRDLLMQQLSERIEYDSVENPDGSVNISLSNGFPLVAGVNSRSLDVTTEPNGTASNATLLDGTSMGFIVYDYDTTGLSPAHLDLTSVLKNGTGSIGGLLAIRGTAPISASGAFAADGVLVDFASRVEAIAQNLVQVFNNAYQGNDTDGATAGVQSDAVDLDGNRPGMMGFFSLSGLTNGDIDGADGSVADQIVSQDELRALQTNGTITSVASLLQVAISDPRAIAAAQDDGAAGIAGLEGDATNLTGVISAISAAQDFGAVGSFSRSGVTFNQVYNELVGRVGNVASRTSIDYSVAESSYTATQAKRDEVSAVSLDEEFTNLIKFQKAFEANARVLRIGGELLDSILQVL